MKTLPAGKYYIGDCCYVLTESHYKWMEFCSQFFEDGEQISINGHSIVAYSTSWGDGTYPSNVNFEFPVDAGLIGIVPAEMWKDEGEPFGCLLVEFEQLFMCTNDNGLMQFGNVIINTRCDEDQEDDESYQ